MMPALVVEDKTEPATLLPSARPGAATLTDHAQTVMVSAVFVSVLFYSLEKLLTDFYTNSLYWLRLNFNRELHLL